VSAATVVVVAPLGVEKTQPCTETTLFTASPAMPLVVKFVKVVAEVVCTVMTTGSQGGAVPAVAEAGTKKHGIVARLKLSELALTAATVPVIWLGSRLMLVVVKETPPW
jgi:hypothetical protein